jgi:hypothetical protein
LFTGSAKNRRATPRQLDTIQRNLNETADAAAESARATIFPSSRAEPDAFVR